MPVQARFVEAIVSNSAVGRTRSDLLPCLDTKHRSFLSAGSYAHLFAIKDHLTGTVAPWVPSGGISRYACQVESGNILLGVGGHKKAGDNASAKSGVFQAFVGRDRFSGRQGPRLTA